MFNYVVCVLKKLSGTVRGGSSDCMPLGTSLTCPHTIPGGPNKCHIIITKTSQVRYS